MDLGPDLPKRILQVRRALVAVCGVLQPVAHCRKLHIDLTAILRACLRHLRAQALNRRLVRALHALRQRADALQLAVDLHTQRCHGRCDLFDLGGQPLVELRQAALRSTQGFLHFLIQTNMHALRRCLAVQLAEALLRHGQRVQARAEVDDLALQQPRTLVEGPQRGTLVGWRLPEAHCRDLRPSLSHCFPDLVTAFSSLLRAVAEQGNLMLQLSPVLHSHLRHLGTQGLQRRRVSRLQPICQRANALQLTVDLHPQARQGRSHLLQLTGEPPVQGRQVTLRGTECLVDTTADVVRTSLFSAACTSNCSSQAFIKLNLRLSEIHLQLFHLLFGGIQPCLQVAIAVLGTQLCLLLQLCEPPYRLLDSMF
mmetsp:Transcript_25209/g.63296  ORF Transcript_25209/g.63296 Transcript_25209/m.63296 type:complete len:368 (-) Transcript_25209:19-1122(-)